MDFKPTFAASQESSLLSKITAFDCKKPSAQTTIKKSTQQLFIIILLSIKIGEMMQAQVIQHIVIGGTQRRRRLLLLVPYVDTGEHHIHIWNGFLGVGALWSPDCNLCLRWKTSTCTIIIFTNS